MAANVPIDDHKLRGRDGVTEERIEEEGGREEGKQDEEKYDEDKDEDEDDDLEEGEGTHTLPFSHAFA